MKINNLVKFNDKCLFDGAVQLDWLYDKNLNKDVALSYVFHGPKYHGVSEKGINSNYSLTDTASFVEQISEKLYTDNVGNKFILAISSYGTGKSHLSVTMANLLADGSKSELSKKIIKRIKEADVEIGTNIERKVKGKNLIIAINGVKDANLNSMVLESAKKALKRDGIDETILEDVETSISKAKDFLDISYESNSEKYLELIEKYTHMILDKTQGKKFLLKNINSQIWAFEIINEVFGIVTGGSEIRMDGSFSAGEILTILNKKLIQERGIYNKILIIFDEFGRFIEYAASYPRAAGDSALQQIYEAVQNANGNMLFLGFIQFDIETYISRVVDNPNISKYLGRYKFADKKYLSSNLETIFANILTKNNELFKIYVENVMDTGFKSEAEKQHRNILRWIKGINQKDVWKNYELYKNIILKGCYPFHPLTIWLLTNLSTWMQDRSTINYLSEAFKNRSSDNIEKGYLSFIYPIDIISDEFIKEIKGAEEKGLQQSNFCTLYYNIETQMKNKLEDKEINVLKSVLITNILGIKPHDKEDLLLAMSYCTGYDNEEIAKIIDKLENSDGVIIFNPTYNVFDFSIESNGKSEFMKIKLLKSKRNPISEVIEFLNSSTELRTSIRLDEAEETDFGYDFISSTEWKFSKAIEAVEDIDDGLLSHYVGKITRNTNGETPRGQVIFLYVNNLNERYLSNIVNLINSKNIDEEAIVFKIIRDNDKELYNALNEYMTLGNFSNYDREKFERFYKDDIDKVKRRITKYFTIANTKGSYLTKDGETNIGMKLKEACKSKFKQIYYNAIPFKFDGLDKSNKNIAIRYHSEILDGLINGNFKNKNVLDYNKPDISNRIKSLLGANIYNSWDAIGAESQITRPRREQIVTIYNQVEKCLDEYKKQKVGLLFKKYLFAPYGMNEYSLEILVALFIFNYSGRLRVRLNGIILSPERIVNSIYDKKKISIDKLYSLELELLEENQEELLDRIIEEGTNLSDISRCDEYLERLERKISSIPLYDEYEKKISIIREKMADGKKRYNNIKVYLPLLKENLVKFSELGYENSYDAIKIMPKIVENYIFVRGNTKYSDSSKFKISEDIQETFRYISILIKKIDKKKFRKTLELVQCENYKEFIGVNMEFNELINKLTKLKLTDLVQIVQLVLKDKEVKLREIEKNKELVNKINLFIKENENLNEKSINYLKNLSNKISETVFQIKIIEMSQIVKDDLVSRIDKLKIHYENELENRKNDLCTRINLIYNYKSTDELKIELSNLSRDIEAFNDTQINNKYIQLRDDLNELDVEISKINLLERKELVNYKKSMGQIDNKFSTIIKHVIDIDEQKLINKEISWIKKVDLKNSSNLSDLDIDKLQRKKYELEVYPCYLSKENIDLVSEKIKKIDLIIKEKSIDWVVELFEKLEKESRKKCFERIEQEYRNNM